MDDTPHIAATKQSLTPEKNREAHVLTLSAPFWYHLRWQLVLGFVLFAILPTLIVSLITLSQIKTVSVKQIYVELEAIANLKQNQVEHWLDDSDKLLDVYLAIDGTQDRLTAYVESNSGHTNNLEEQAIISQLFQAVIEEQAYFSELFLYDVKGNVIAASNPVQIGKVLNRRPYFDESLTQAVVQPPYYEAGVAGITMIMTRPILGTNGQTVAVLAGRLNMENLGKIMGNRTGLGQSGETYLVSKESNYLVTPSRFEEQGYPLIQAYFSEGINRALDGENGAAVYDDYRNPAVRVIGVYRWLPEFQVGLLAEIDEQEALASYSNTQELIILFNAIALLIAIAIGINYGKRISQPVTKLTQAATLFASGRWKPVKIAQPFEIKLLGQTFNEMASQISQLFQRQQQQLESLEQAREALQTSETRLRALIDGVPDMIFRINVDGTFLDYKANPSQLAVQADKLIGSNLKEAPFSTDIIEDLLKINRQSIESGQVHTYEYALNVPLGQQYFETRVVKSGPDEAVHIVRNITGRKEMVEKLRQSREQAQAQYKAFPVPTYTFQYRNGDLFLMDYNHATERITKGGVKNLMNKSLDQMLGTRPDLVENIWRCYQEKEVFQKEVEYNMETIGKKLWFLTTYAYVAPDLVMVHTDDITERKTAEEKLHASEARYRTLFSQSPDGIMLVDPETTKAIEFNSAMANLLGYSMDEFAELRVQDYEANENPAEVAAHVKNVIQGGKDVFETKMRTKSGEIKEVQVNIQLIELSGKKVFHNIVHDLTKIKASEKALRESEERYMLAVQAANDGIWDWDIMTDENYMSPRWKEIVGYEDHELPNVASSFFELVHPDDIALLNDTLERHLEENEPFNFELRLKHKAGHYVWVENRGGAVWNADGEPVRMVGSITDISERKKAQEEIAFQANLLQNVTDAIYATDLSFNATSWNKAAEKLYGWQEEEVLGRSIRELIHPRYRDQFPEEVRNQLLVEGYWHGEAENTRKDGSTIDVIASAQSLRDSTGRVIGIVGMSHDITERKRTEKKLEENQILLKEAQHVAKVGHWTWDLTTDEVNWSDETFRIFGVDPKTFNVDTESYFSFIHPNDLAGQRLFIKELREQKGSSRREYRIIRADGAIRTLAGEARIHMVKDGQPAKAFGIVQDITEQKKIEQKIKESEIRYRILSELSSDVAYEIQVSNNDELIIEWIWGSINDILDFNIDSYRSVENWLAHVDPRDRSLVSEQVQQLLSGGDVTYDFRIEGNNGEIRWLRNSTRAVELDAQGKSKRIIGAIQDITALKKIQEQIQTSLEEKEVLLKEIHHRVKNNLQVISSLLDLQADYAGQSEVSGVLRDSRSRVRSMAMVHEQLYQSSDLAKIEIADYIQGLARYLYEVYGNLEKSIDLQLEMDSIYLSIESAVPLGLIINELVSNACKHAFPNGQAGEININLSPTDDHQLMLIVQDNGIGIPQDFNILDYSSMGMTIVNTLTEQLKGHLTLHRQNGTRFEIVFPI